MADVKHTPCPNAENGKHKWVFLRNAGQSKMTFGPNGSRGSFKVVALYECACGAKRTGGMNHNAPGNDLRDHFGGAARATEGSAT